MTIRRRRQRDRVSRICRVLCFQSLVEWHSRQRVPFCEDGAGLYALGEVRTPVKISIICLALNLVLAIVLVLQFEPNLRQGAFGIANTISSTLNAALLWSALRRRKELAPVALPGLRRQLPMMVGFAGMAGLAAWGISRGFDNEAETLQERLILVFVPLLGAGSAYWAMSGLAGVDSAKAIFGILYRPRRK